MPIDPRIPLMGQPAQLTSPIEAFTAITQLQAVREQTEARRLAAETAREVRTRQARYEAALRKATTIGPDGRPTIDLQSLLGDQLDAGTLFEVQKTIDENATRMATLQTSKLTQAEKATAYLGGLGRSVQAAKYHPDAFGVAVTSGVKAGALTQAQADQMLAEAASDPAAIQRYADSAVAQAAEAKAPEGFTLSPGEVRYGPTGQVIATGAAKPAEHSAIYKEWQDYQSTGGTLDFNAYQTMDANRRRAVTHINTGQATDADVQEMLSGMIEGTLPPQLPGRASPLYTKILAAAHRRNFDLAGAATDWAATQKHIATMNGAQQLRLNQAVNALPEMLDKVDALASKWNAGRFAVLNRANLAAAKNGLYGQQAATIATQLDAQIADVVADLGNVYMGGNSPTDHALSLAQKSLSADWSEPVLKSMVALAKQNVQIRRNSINSTGVAGASADNPYMPAPPPAAAGPKEGDVQPIPGFPGMEQTYKSGKWIRTK